MRTRRSLLGWAFLGWTALALGGESAPRPFVSGSLPAITAPRTGRAFLLNLWSLNCPPCRSELALLARLVRDHPRFDLVLIAADAPADAEKVQRVLAERGLSGVESWIFGEANPQRLRYEIDAGWYGELPRNYFYDPAHDRISVSGVLKEEQLSAWIAAVERQTGARTKLSR